MIVVDLSLVPSGWVAKSAILLKSSDDPGLSVRYSRTESAKISMSDVHREQRRGGRIKAINLWFFSINSFFLSS